MNVWTLIAALLAIGLLFYLVVVLFKPESLE
jgi:K+-transporting ATPase KdpF subunit